MKNKISKLETLSIIKNAKNVESYVEYENNYFTIDLKGEIVPKQDQQITLQKIYELVLGLKEETSKRFDNLETKVDNLENETKQRFDKLETEIRLIKEDIRILKKLSTIAKELKDL